MLTVPFLTDLDPRAAVKGSRDPLGAQVIWSHLGRNIVQNLTTVTTNAHEFLTVLLGVYFSALVGEGEAKPESFLRFEQVAAYARQEYGTSSVAVRGVERVKKNLTSGAKLTISADARDQILSDQKMYGLWGLFLGASRASGLIEEKAVRLTPWANAFVVANFADVLVHERRIRKLISSESTVALRIQGSDSELCQCLAKHLAGSKFPARVRRPLRERLVANASAPQADVQRQLAVLLNDNEVLTDSNFDRGFVVRLFQAAQEREFEQLGRFLQRILACESVIAPAIGVYSFLLASDRETVPHLVAALEETWPDGAPVHRDIFRDIDHELRQSVQVGDLAPRWQRVADALRDRAYEPLIRDLVEINRLVMEARGGAAWIDLPDDRIVVNISGEGSDLPVQEDLPNLWKYPYFLNSIQSIAWQLREL